MSEGHGGVKPVCEDGALCICTGSHSVKSWNRKVDGQELTEADAKQNDKSDGRFGRMSVFRCNESDGTSLCHTNTKSCEVPERYTGTDSHILESSAKDSLDRALELKISESTNSLPDLVTKDRETKALCKVKKKQNSKRGLKKFEAGTFSDLNSLKDRETLKVRNRRNNFASRLKEPLAALNDSDTEETVANLDVTVNRYQSKPVRLKSEKQCSTRNNQKRKCSVLYKLENNVLHTNCNQLQTESSPPAGNTDICRTESDNQRTDGDQVLKQRNCKRKLAKIDTKETAKKPKSDDTNVRNRCRPCSETLEKETCTDIKKNNRSVSKGRILKQLKSQVHSKRQNKKTQANNLSKSLTENIKDASMNTSLSEALNASLPNLSNFKDISETDKIINDAEVDVNDHVMPCGIDKDECDDSDDDLPVFLTPIKIEKYFQEKDLVWVKWKNWPHVPAMVKNVYKKKKRMTCLVFAPEDKPEQPWSVSTSGGKVWSYFDKEKKKEILKISEDLGPEDKEYFKECMLRVDTYLTKKALGEIKDDFAFVNNKEYLYSNGELVERDNEVDGKVTKEDIDSIDEGCVMDDESTIEEFTEEESGLSKRGQQRKEKIKKKTQKFVDFLLSPECKKYLQGIFLGKTKSELQKVFFTGSAKEKAKMKHKGYGPIDDDDQILTMLLTFTQWLKEINNNTNFNDNAYVLDVWAPEAIVYGYQKYFTYSKKRAWEMFYKGPRRTKEELLIDHNVFKDQMKNLSAEDKQRLREKEEEILRVAGIEPMNLDYNV